MGPGWLAHAFAALLLVIAVNSAGRIVAARALRRATWHDIEIAQVVMGVAMAGMFVPRLNPLPMTFWYLVFGAATAWFGIRVLRGAYADHLLHVLTSVAMLYMFAVGVGGGGMHGMAEMDHARAGGARLPALALAAALFLFGYAVLLLERVLVTGGAGAAAAGRQALAPRTATCGTIVMCVSMGYMLVTLL